MLIRPETEADIEAIAALTDRAFAPMPHSAGTEPAIIAALRAAGELALSLVAEIEGEIVGQITLSPVSIAGVHADWYGLGPVAVVPERQKAGIGHQLIEAALEWLVQRGAGGCVLVGDPNYYHRFGFVGESGLTYKGLDTQYIQQKPLGGGALRQGEVLYAPAFEVTA